MTLQKAIGESIYVIVSSHEGLDEFEIIDLKEVDSPMAVTLRVTNRFA